MLEPLGYNIFKRKLYVYKCLYFLKLWGGIRRGQVKWRDRPEMTFNLLSTSEHGTEQKGFHRPTGLPLDPFLWTRWNLEELWGCKDFSFQLQGSCERNSLHKLVLFSTLIKEALICKWTVLNTETHNCSKYWGCVTVECASMHKTLMSCTYTPHSRL